jgi:hypothetical protein
MFRLTLPMNFRVIVLISLYGLRLYSFVVYWCRSMGTVGDIVIFKTPLARSLA